MKKSSQWFTIFIQLAFGGCIGAFIGYNIDTIFDNQTINLPIILYGFFIIVISYIVQIIVHEAGHLIFGLMSGYTFVSFRIGSLTWIKDDNHIILKRFSLAGTAGQCLLAPPPYENNQYPSFLYNLGGSVFNLIISLISLLMYFLFKENSLLSILFLFLSLFGIYFGLMNGIPLQLNGMNNDGYNALQIHHDIHAKKAFWLTLKINELIAKGIRLKDMDDSLFVDPAEEEVTTHLSASLLISNFQRTLDQKDFVKAQNILDFIHQNNVPLLSIHKQLLANDEIYCLLISSPEVSIDHLYTKELKKIIKAMKKYPSIVRTQYTISLLHEKDETKANEYLQQFKELSKTYPYQADLDSERELMVYASQIYQQNN